jgi:hypothetical protein
VLLGTTGEVRPNPDRGVVAVEQTSMGNVVDPRREFIQDSTLKVVNLDV